MTGKHIGGAFDDFLRDEGILDDAEAVAAKRVIAFQIAREMELAHISQSELARRMKTSRSSVERLLDPTNPSVTLQTLERAASAVGKRLKIHLTTKSQTLTLLEVPAASAGRRNVTAASAPPSR